MSLEEMGQRVDFETEDERPATDEARHVDPDVVLEVPVLNIEELQLDVEDLTARISLQAELADFVRVNVGVDAHITKAKLNIKGVEAQAVLRVSLEGVLNTIDRALDTIDRNPGILGTTGDASSDRGDDPEDGALAQLQNAASGEAPSAEDPDEGTGAGVGATEVEATDAARRRAEALGVDLAGVEGTGFGGRVVVRDVQKAAR